MFDDSANVISVLGCQVAQQGHHGLIGQTRPRQNEAIIRQQTPGDVAANTGQIHFLKPIRGLFEVLSAFACGKAIRKLPHLLQVTRAQALLLKSAKKQRAHTPFGKQHTLSLKRDARRIAIGLGPTLVNAPHRVNEVIAIREILQIAAHLQHVRRCR